MHPDWYWMIPFTIIDNVNRIFFGIFGTLLGPSQPYFADVQGVGLDTINWIYPIGAFCSVFGAIISSFTFKKYFKTPRQKMSFFFLATLALGVSSVIPPYTRTFGGFLVAVSLRTFFGTLLETPCQSLYIYTLGPERSQLLIMLFHFTVGLGFLMGPLIIRPFFPEESSGAGTAQDDYKVCHHDQNNIIDIVNDTAAHGQGLEVLESIVTPYWIVLYGHLICCLGYLVMMVWPYEMPVFLEEDRIGENKKSSKPSKKSWTNSLTMSDCAGIIALVAFYTATCGSERLFQGMEFTFGLCGPLALHPKDAVLTDQFYNGGFMLGRLLSILAVKLMSPKMMIKASILICLICTVGLSAEADSSANLLYVCAAMFGMSVSWQYGAGFSWAAENMDVVGPRASLFSLGCSLGALSPILGGYLFNRVSPMAMWHLNLVQVLIQIAAFYVMHFLFKNHSSSMSSDCETDSPATYKGDNNRSAKYRYKELNQMEDVNLSSSELDD